MALWVVNNECRSKKELISSAYGCNGNHVDHHCIFKGLEAKMIGPALSLYFRIKIISCPGTKSAGRAAHSGIVCSNVLF